MNVMLQRHCARYIYVVPEGLKELMTDISREVIRSDPPNIYTFIADYLDALLITRENARVAARLVQSITEIATTTVEFLQKTGMERVEADRIVSIIQKLLRRSIQSGSAGASTVEESEEVNEINFVSDVIHQADIPPELGEEAARIIQSAFRRFKARRDKERELLSGMVDWRAAARSAIRLYRKTGVTYEEANRAATLIKAAYKGYYTRRIMRKLAEESRLQSERLEEEEFEEEETFEPDLDQKFVKIDYGSIIPHVDFDEANVIETTEESLNTTTTETKRDESTTSAVVCSTIEGILDMTFQEMLKKESILEEHIVGPQEIYQGEIRKDSQYTSEEARLSKVSQHTTEEAKDRKDSDFKGEETVEGSPQQAEQEQPIVTEGEQVVEGEIKEEGTTEGETIDGDQITTEVKETEEVKDNETEREVAEPPPEST